MKNLFFPMLIALALGADAAAQSGAATPDSAMLNQCLEQADFPYTFSFENGLEQWQQPTLDDTDWSLKSGPTPSKHTGPEAAFDGTTYAFIEATGAPSRSAYLVSPCYILPAGSSAAISFAYNMYGAQMGTLRLQISANNGGSWTNLWSKSTRAPNAVWKIATQSLAAYAGSTIRLRFWGKTAGEASDMAIDNITISTGQPSVLPENSSSD